MNTTQKIIDAIYQDLNKINTDNGYQISLRDVSKGFIQMPNDLPVAYFYPESDSMEVWNEDKSLGLFTIPFSIYIYFNVDTGPGNITDACETVLQDLNDWVIGTKGTGKCLSLVTPLPNYIRSIYIKKHFRAADFNQINASYCGIELEIKFLDNI